VIVKNIFSSIVITLSLFLTACAGYSSAFDGGSNDTKEWIAQKEQEKANYDKKIAAEQIARLQKIQEEERQFELSNPEVEVEFTDIHAISSAEKKFAKTINGLGFVTRYPKAQSVDNVYVKVGNYKLTMKRIQIALKSYADECKRISAYNDSDFKGACISSLTKAINNFSDMVNNEGIPAKTKSTALSEASFDYNYIDFEHSARLARMHTELCQKQDNKGYVAMITVAAPCGGQGDVYNIYAARKMGLL
jgi:hypothetical protein